MLSESKYWQIFRWNFWARNPKPYWSLYIVLLYYMICNYYITQACTQSVGCEETHKGSHKTVTQAGRNTGQSGDQMWIQLLLYVTGLWKPFQIAHCKLRDNQILKHYNQPRIVSMQMKLTQKVDHFIVFESFPSTSCCSQKFLPNKIEKLAGLMCEVASGMFTLGGWR